MAEKSQETKEVWETVAMQTGKVYIKGDRWYFRYQEPVIEGGQKKWRDRYINLAPRERFSSATAAEKECRQVINEALGKAEAMTADTMTPVNDFIANVYFAGRKDDLRASTLVGYKNLYARHLKQRFEGLRLCDFKLQIAQDILNRIARDNPKLSSQTMKHLKWFSVSVFNFAAQRGAFNPEAKNPFFETAIPKTPQHRSEPTRLATLDQILDMIDTLEEPAATVVALAAFSGLRKSEIQGLRWEDLKDDELHVQRTAWRPTQVVEQTKTEASRGAVPVIPDLAKHLEEHRSDFPADGFIFTGAKMGRPLDLHNLANRVIRPALEKKNIPWCGWHGFRRGLATNLYGLGVEAKTRQAILRHADVSVTEKHYVKPVSEVSAAAMAKFHGALTAKIKARAAEKRAQSTRRAGAKRARANRSALRTSIRTRRKAL
jgi:integrase